MLRARVRLERPVAGTGAFETVAHLWARAAPGEAWIFTLRPHAAAAPGVCLVWRERRFRILARTNADDRGAFIHLHCTEEQP
jgi:hypothetical protein